MRFGGFFYSLIDKESFADTLEKSKSRMDDCCYSEMREPYPCSYCVCLRNSSKEQDSGREQKAVDYFKVASLTKYQITRFSSTNFILADRRRPNRSPPTANPRLKIHRKGKPLTSLLHEGQSRK